MLVVPSAASHATFSQPKAAGKVPAMHTVQVREYVNLASNANWVVRPLTGGDELMSKSPIPPTISAQPLEDNLPSSSAVLSGNNNDSSGGMASGDCAMKTGGTTGVRGKSNCYLPTIAYLPLISAISILSVFHMELLSNWGYPGAIGLTGVQFLGERLVYIP